MKLKFKIFIFCLLLSCIGVGQTTENIKQVKKKIQSADSVLLISHEVTEEYGIKFAPDWDIRDTSMNLKKWKELNPPLLKFIKNGKINRQIIVESAKLSDSAKNVLSLILGDKIRPKIENSFNCDEPRHSIIIYKGATQSYINICFGCRRIHTSKDIRLSEINFDNRKWSRLKLFFKSSGLIQIFKEYDE